MNRNEILKLHELCDIEQVDVLKKWGVLQKKVAVGCTSAKKWNKYESLADCAFRLRDEIYSGTISNYARHEWFLEYLFTVSDIIIGIKELNKKDSTRFWLSEAKPIHWIQAALLAKEEYGKSS